MRAVLTRVKSASVSIDGQVVGKIGQGFLILLGVGPTDTEKECRYLAEKALGLRVFEDENGKMNLGLDTVNGEVLVVSQFTLYGNCRKGRRPSFTDAAAPDLGNALYETDPEAYQAIRSTLPPEVNADLRDNNAYWDQFRDNVVEKVTDTVYDAALKC